MSRPPNHTEDCECPACVAEVAPKPPEQPWPGLPPQQDVQWKFDPVRGQWWPRNFGGVRLVFPDGITRPASVTDGQWPPLVGNALTRYQKERALLSAVTTWGQRSDEWSQALIHEDSACVRYQDARRALGDAIAQVNCCWRDLQAVGGPLP